MLQIDGEPGGLHVRTLVAAFGHLAILGQVRTFRRRDAATLERPEQALDSALHEAGPVGVFDAQDERPSVMEGEQLVIESGTETADMEKARRGRCESEEHTSELQSRL